MVRSRSLALALKARSGTFILVLVLARGSGRRIRAGPRRGYGPGLRSQLSAAPVPVLLPFPLRDTQRIVHYVFAVCCVLCDRVPCGCDEVTAIGEVGTRGKREGEEEEEEL